MSTRQQIDHLLAQLEAAGKRSTPQRHAVCQALVEHGGHPTVAEIFERVRAIFPMISQATVYNTVDTLRDLGSIRPLDLSTDGHTHYDLDPSAHLNLVCTACGAIRDLHTASLDMLLSQVSQRSGYALDPHSPLVIYGVCAACRSDR
jgi:Fur family transcriptional regulator, peroxide stress response regulator